MEAKEGSSTTIRMRVCGNFYHTRVEVYVLTHIVHTIVTDLGPSLGVSGAIGWLGWFDAS